MEGTPFGRYRLVELLGRGGMGEVWRAYDTGTDRIVAVKVLPSRLASNPEYNKRFRREAHAAAGLDSPHVIPIHDFGEIDGRLFVDMRLINGSDLAAAIAAGPLRPARAVGIVDQVGRALHSAHVIGLIHRDVKPSNIMLDRDDYAYLIDFGIAHVVSDRGLTQPGSTVGTWAYMAPERFGDGHSDARSDVYALTCVLHECLTGAVPYPAKSLEQVVVAHMMTAPPRPSDTDPSIPRSFDDVIACGLAKEPDQRYATTKDLAAAARNALTDADGTTVLTIRRRVAATLIEQTDNDTATFGWPPPEDPERSPYRGWKPLDEVDAAVFFGRSAQISRALEALRTMRTSGATSMFVILGPSGTGKSSFLRAGVLPRLRRDDHDFELLDIVRPQRNVLTGNHGLARSIHAARLRYGLGAPSIDEISQACLAGSGRQIAGWLGEVRASAHRRNGTQGPAPTLLLPLDQGEELFNVDGGTEAATFLQLVAELSALMNPREGNGAPGLIVAVTIRTDCYESLQTAPQLHDVRSVVFDELKPMPRALFREVIIGPAARATQGGHQLTLEPALVDRLLDDCGAGADTLPLLALTMSRLYEDYSSEPSGDDLDPTTLTLARYEAMGGIHRVVSTEIGKILSPNPERRNAELAALRAAFIPWLATINPDNDQPMRRVARWSDIPERSRAIVDRFVTRRLLVRADRGGESSVEVALESLLRQWDELGRWLADERENLKAADVLEHAALAWRAHRHDEAWLLQGSRLADAERLAAAPAFAARLRSLRDYLEASRRSANDRYTAELRRRDSELHAAQQLVAAESHARWQAQAHAAVLKKRSRVLRIAVVVMVLIAATAAFGWVRAYRAEARAQAALAAAADRERETIALRLGSQGESMLADVQPGGDVRAIQQILSAPRISAEVDEGSLLTAVTLTSDMQKIIEVGPDVDSVAVSPGGDRVVVSVYEEGLQIWDPVTGERLEEIGGTATESDVVALSRDGSQIAAADYLATLRIWDTSSGDEVGDAMSVDGELWANSVVFSPDGRRIAVGYDDGTVRIWDAVTNRQVGETLVGPVDAWALAVAFSPDGRRVAVGYSDNSLQMWDADTGKTVGVPLTGHTDWVRAVAYTPDGQRLVSVSDDATVRIWDANNGAPVGVPLTGHTDWLRAVAVSPDGQQIASAGDDGTIRLWDAATGESVGQPATGHGDSVVSVAFTADGEQIVSGSRDDTVRVWDAGVDGSVGDVLAGDAGTSITASAVSPDGQRIVCGDAEGKLWFWDTLTGESVGQPLTGHDEWIEALAYSPDGTRIASAADDSTVRVFDAESGETVAGPLDTGADTWPMDVAFSADGTRVVAGVNDGTVWVWDARSGDQIGETIEANDDGIYAVAFSPDGQQVLAEDDDGEMQFYDVETGEPEGNSMEGMKDGVTVAEYSPDGTRMLFGDGHGNLQVWDVQTREPIGDAFPAHDGGVTTIAFSADGQTVVTSGQDYRMRIWRLDTREPIGSPLSGHESYAKALALTSDSRHIISSSADGTLRLWPGPASWAEMLCDKLPYNMNAHQWDEWVSGDIDYIPACEGLPEAPDS